MTSPIRYSAEVRDRAVRLVLEHQDWARLLAEV